MIRDARPEDFGEILRINAEWESVTSPLDEASLASLHASAAYHRVFETGSRIAAFLLALAPGADYTSPNYLWFADRLDDFIYIDRIVVSTDAHRSGIGAALYDDLREAALEMGATRLVCEVDAEPLNQASDAFHTRRGFMEIGTQRIHGAKRVSYREAPLP